MKWSKGLGLPALGAIVVGTLLLAGPTAPAAVPPSTAAAAPLPQDARLVGNGDFETTGAAGTVPGWDVIGTSVTQPASGTGHVVRVARPTGGEAVYARSQRVTVLPGELVVATAQTRRISGGAGTLRIQFWRADGSYVGQRAAYQQVSASGSTAWSAVSVRGFAPDDATSATVAVVALADGTNEWDDVRLDSTPPSTLMPPDSGFEDRRDDPGHAPGYWALADGAVKRTLPVASGDPAYSGDRVLELTDASTTLAPMATSRRLPLSGSGYLTVSAWARSLNGDLDGDGHTATMVLRFFTTTGTSVTTVELAAPTAWTEVRTGAVPLPAGTLAFDVYFYSSKPDRGTTQWDDLRVSRTDAAGAPVAHYDPAVSTGTVLLVGDDRVESTSGLTRTVHLGEGPSGGTAAAPVVDWSGNSSGYTSAVARASLPVQLQSGDTTWREWWLWTEKQLLRSCDGITWPTSSAANADPAPCVAGGQPRTSRVLTGEVPSNVTANPAWTPGSTTPRFYGMAAGSENYASGATTRCREIYFPVESDDGVAWSRTPASESILGRDTANLVHDGARYRAAVKQWRADGAVAASGTCGSYTYTWQPRSVWMTTSTDLTDWTAPTFSLGADVLDMRAVAARFSSYPRATTDIYQMPLTEYGDQLIGTPWMFDIYDPEINGASTPGMNRDVGPEHIEIASSRNGLSWSRPARSRLIRQSQPWDDGFMMTSNQMHVTPTETRLYYSSYEGHHATTTQGSSRIGLAIWKRDRMVSLGTTGTGTVVTKPLTPAATRSLVINAKAAGSVKVEVLDADGDPVPGYRSADVLPFTGDELDHPVTWTGGATLPDPASTGGSLRLRFTLVDASLYAFRLQ